MIEEAALAARKVIATAGFVASEIAQAWHAPFSNDPRARAVRNQAVCRAMCELHAIEPRVTGALPVEPAVLVANHLSYIDPLVIGAVVACLGIAKAEIADWPVLGARMRDLGVLFVRRGDPRSGARALRAALAALHQGTSVLNFPEGTTTRGDLVLPFRRGIFGIARHAGVPIVPIRIAFDDPRMAWVGDATLLPHYWMLARKKRVVAHLHFGPTIDPHVPGSVRVRGPAAELASRAREAIASGRSTSKKEKRSHAASERIRIHP